jgi:uncharacterized membrane protein YtjA (UPF0391 family)
MTMLRLAVLLLVIALIAGFLGWGVANDFMWAAKICFVVFLILAVLSFFGHGYRRRSFRE